ncbi:MAG: ParA family protein [Pseudomonadota bacterium]
MRSVLVLNPKGGSGKTTLATNLAVYYALKGHRTTLLDLDPQGSATDWLAERGDTRAPIDGVYAADGSTRIPRNTEVLIMDAPAGAQGRDLSELLRRAQSALVPVVPSAIDLRALARFYDELMSLSRVNNAQIRIATVANRVRELSPNRVLLEEYLRSLKLPNGRRLPFTTVLRQSQAYVKAAERGLGIFELAPSLVAHELELWQPLLRWLNSKRSLPES